jgi:hypothetical protein
MKKIVLYLFAFLCGVILSACGGGGGGSSPTPPTPTPDTVTPPSIGVFVDSAIENIKYRTKTLNGYTNADGQFKFLPGESVIFSIGSIDLPEVAASKIITPLDLAKKSSNQANALDNLLVLLQSLDNDQDPSNGIKLTEESKSLSTTGLDLNAIPSNFSSNSSPLIALITAAKVSKNRVATSSPVSLQSARDHFTVANPSIKAVAVAESSGKAVVGNTITLNGSASYDPSGLALSSYRWSVTGSPAYSNATINNPTSSSASLSINVAGEYVIQLSVTNAAGQIGIASIAINGVPNPKFGTSILTLYATRTGVDLSCNSGEDDSSCDKRLVQLIHTENLGCLTCDATQVNSICNIEGKFGSLDVTSTQSIWNTSINQYGSAANQSSPWNSSLNGADKGPILRITPLLLTAYTDVIDERAIAFTLNDENSWLAPYLPDSVNEPLLLDMLTAYKEAGSSAIAKREAVCNKLSEAMQ